MSLSIVSSDSEFYFDLSRYQYERLSSIRFSISIAEFDQISGFAFGLDSDFYLDQTFDLVFAFDAIIDSHHAENTARKIGLLLFRAAIERFVD